MMKNTLTLLSVGAVVGFLSACSPPEDASSAPPTPPPGAATSPPASAGAAPAVAASEAPAQPPPVAFGGPTTTEGLPAQDESGNSMDTLAALQYASEVYERLKAMDYPDDEEAAKRWKPRPPLTDLQQLVQYRIIRAVPAAPAGQKYVYDAQTKKVKLVSQ
jgi:hypothetical protein